MTKKAFKAFFVIFCLIGVLSVAYPAAAQNLNNGNGTTLSNPLACPTFSACVGKVISFMLVIAAPIVTIMVIYGGFLILTAGGDSEKVSTGKKTILYAAIGFLVILVANSVAPLIQNIFQ